jgi:hypothetical protein
LVSNIPAGDGKSQTFFYSVPCFALKSIIGPDAITGLDFWAQDGASRSYLTMGLATVTGKSFLPSTEELHILYDLVRLSLFKGCAPIPTGV